MADDADADVESARDDNVRADAGGRAGDENYFVSAMQINSIELPQKQFCVNSYGPCFACELRLRVIHGSMILYVTYTSYT